MLEKEVRKREVMYDGHIDYGDGTMPTGIVAQANFLNAIIARTPPEMRGELQAEYRVLKQMGDEDVMISIFYLRPPSEEEVKHDVNEELSKDVGEYNRIAKKYGKPYFGQTTAEGGNHADVKTGMIISKFELEMIAFMLELEGSGVEMKGYWVQKLSAEFIDSPAKAESFYELKAMDHWQEIVSSQKPEVI